MGVLLVFAKDVVIFAESLEVLVIGLEALRSPFGGLLDETVESIHACGEVIDILDSFKYLGSVVYNNGESRQEVLRQIGYNWNEYLALSVPVQTDKYFNLQITGDPCLTVRL